MRKFLVTLSALALSAGVANAGALVTPTPEPIIPAPAPVIHTGYDWTGGYAGVGLTYGRASYRRRRSLVRPYAIWGDITDPREVDGFPNGSGWGLGGFVGYNWQNGGMVYGVEGHLSGHRMRGNLDVTATAKRCPHRCPQHRLAAWPCRRRPGSHPVLPDRRSGSRQRSPQRHRHRFRIAQRQRLRDRCRPRARDGRRLEPARRSGALSLRQP
jgi:opacity protein-like surface antigen